MKKTAMKAYAPTSQADDKMAMRKMRMSKTRAMPKTHDAACALLWFLSLLLSLSSAFLPMMSFSLYYVFLINIGKDR